MKNRILIVEDDFDISDIIVMNLQYSGYEYVAIDDGTKAANYLSNFRFRKFLRKWCSSLILLPEWG